MRCFTLALVATTIILLCSIVLNHEKKDMGSRLPETEKKYRQTSIVLKTQVGNYSEKFYKLEMTTILYSTTPNTVEIKTYVEKKISYARARLHINPKTKNQVKIFLQINYDSVLHVENEYIKTLRFSNMKDLSFDELFAMSSYFEELKTFEFKFVTFSGGNVKRESPLVTTLLLSNSELDTDTFHALLRSFPNLNKITLDNGNAGLFFGDDGIIITKSGSFGFRREDIPNEELQQVLSGKK